MTSNLKITLMCVVPLAAFAAGRWACPTKVRVETRTVEVEKKTEQVKTDTARERHVDTVVTVVTRPDGTKTETTHTVQDTHTQQDRRLAETDQSRRVDASLKETIYAESKLTLSVLGGYNPGDFTKPVYGLSLTKPVLGPITLGIWGMSDKTFGCSLGFTF